VAALALLGRGLKDNPQDLEHLAGLLGPQTSSPVQRAALANLSHRRGESVADLLLSRWKSYEPSLRLDVLNVLLARAEWMDRLLDGIEKGSIPATQVSPAHQQKMIGSSQDAIRSRAQKLFA